MDWITISPNEGPEKTMNARYEKQQPTLYARTVSLPLAFVENFSGFHSQDKQNASFENRNVCTFIVRYKFNKKKQMCKILFRLSHNVFDLTYLTVMGVGGITDPLRGSFFHRNYLQAARNRSF